MTRRRDCRLAATVLATLLLSACGAADDAKTPARPESKPVGKELATLEIGQAAPEFKDLIGIDDKQHSLADYRDAKLVVVAFTCNHCPVAVAYEDRLIALQKDYRDKGVQLVAINVNNLPADRLDKMKERAAAKGFNFPYLYDASQQIGRQFGATVTPHVFVLDPQRHIAYKGAIDDNMDVKKAKTHYLRDALDALLGDKAPPQPVSKQFGCGIKYE